MITIICGTNRSDSNSRLMAEYYLAQLQKHHVTARILDLMQLPDDVIASALYENAGKNPHFAQYQQAVDTSDKFIFIVPEYNGSFPGVLKVFIDALRYPDSLQNKMAALVGLSSGMQGGALALSHLNDILSYLGTDVISLRIKIPFIARNFQDGALQDSFIEGLIQDQIQKLISL